MQHCNDFETCNSKFKEIVLVVHPTVRGKSNYEYS